MTASFDPFSDVTSAIPLASSGGNPAAAIAGDVLGTATKGLLTGAQGPSYATAANSINVINPGMINLGEILRPYNEGSLTNGGFGVPLASAWVQSLSGSSPVSVGFNAQGVPTYVWAIVAIGGLAAVLALRKRRG